MKSERRKTLTERDRLRRILCNLREIIARKSEIFRETSSKELPLEVKLTRLRRIGDVAKGLKDLADINMESVTKGIKGLKDMEL